MRFNSQSLDDFRWIFFLYNLAKDVYQSFCKVIRHRDICTLHHKILVRLSKIIIRLQFNSTYIIGVNRQKKIFISCYYSLLLTISIFHFDKVYYNLGVHYINGVSIEHFEYYKSF